MLAVISGSGAAGAVATGAAATGVVAGWAAATGVVVAGAEIMGEDEVDAVEESSAAIAGTNVRAKREEKDNAQIRDVRVASLFAPHFMSGNPFGHFCAVA
jgi:hypothetical protein